MATQGHINGITRGAELMKHSQQPDVIISERNRALTDFTLYTDAPDDALALIGKAARALGWSPQDSAAAIGTSGELLGLDVTR